METKGTKLWNDAEEFNRQLNDPVEQLYKKLIKQIQKKYPQVHVGYLESCGPNAMANCFTSTEDGRRKVLTVCKTLGVYKQQVSHIIIGYLNDPANKDKMNKARVESGAPAIDNDSMQGNRVPQYYPLAAWELFSVKADFQWNVTFDTLKAIVIKGYPVQVCKKKPGHYIAVKAYDKRKDCLVYDDSWRGFNKFMNRAEAKENLQPFYIKYYVK